MSERNYLLSMMELLGGEPLDSPVHEKHRVFRINELIVANSELKTMDVSSHVAQCEIWRSYILAATQFRASVEDCGKIDTPFSKVVFRVLENDVSYSRSLLAMLDSISYDD